MQKRINNKVDSYLVELKNEIVKKGTELNIIDRSEFNELFKFISYYDKLTLNKEDFMKRKRIKNNVPIYDRCCSKRANGEQCTRKKQVGIDFCGTHSKGTPHGVIDMKNDIKTRPQKVDVWVQDIRGILYYIDNNNNVYQPEDIINNKTNPKIIAKYIVNDDKYFIPEFNL